MKDKISIIIPVYKVENCIKQCVESVLVQTYENIEIILVDDGSPDNCPQICENLAKEDGRIIVLHQKNKGLSAARNSGLKIATGKYIIFVDSDDAVHPQYVEVLYKTLKNNDADIAMCNWQKVYNLNNLPIKKIKYKKNNIKEFVGDKCFSLLFEKKVPLIMVAWAKIYKKKFFKNLKFAEDVFQAEDEEIIPKILNKCKKLVYTNEKLYFNLQREESLTGVSFSLKRLSALNVIKDRIDFIRKNKPQFTDDSIYYFMKISILYYYYAKWAKFEKIYLTEIKENLTYYYNLGYSNKLIKLFFKHPKILEFILKIRKGIKK